MGVIRREPYRGFEIIAKREVTGKRVPGTVVMSVYDLFFIGGQNVTEAVYRTSYRPVLEDRINAAKQLIDRYLDSLQS